MMSQNEADELDAFGREEGQVDEPYKPDFLKLWETPDNYYGVQLFGWYSVIGHHRDSGILDESNFDAVFSKLEALEPWPEVEDADGNMVEAVQVHNFSHWAVGWTESIYIHESYEEGLRLADGLMDYLDGYPILDEDDFYEREWEDYRSYIHEYWVPEFVTFCEELEDLGEELENFRQEILYQGSEWIGNLAIGSGDEGLDLRFFYEWGELQSSEIYTAETMRQMFQQMKYVWDKSEAERKADGWEQLPLIQGE